MDLQDKKGNKPLHEALINDHFAIAEELVVRGASQLPNIQRLTPLLLASSNCQIDMVECYKQARMYKGTEN